MCDQVPMALNGLINMYVIVHPCEYIQPDVNRLREWALPISGTKMALYASFNYPNELQFHFLLRETIVTTFKGTICYTNTRLANDEKQILQSIIQKLPRG